MQFRHRTRTRIASSGSFYSYDHGGSSGPFPYVERDDVCDDYVGKTKDPVTGLTPSSPLSIFQRDVKPPLFNYYMHYSFHPPTAYHKYSQVPATMPNATGSVSSPPGGWSALEPSNSEIVAKILSNTNPFRYTISIPVLILELLDATSLLKFAARTFAGLFGGGFLNWKFGYLSMLQDIKTLSTITEAVEARVHEFNDLISAGGSRRRVFVSEKTTREDGSSTFFSSFLGSWGGPVHTEYRSKIWGSVHWHPQRDKLLEVQALTDFNNAVKHVLDLDEPDPSTVWEAIPFSWLVDYFINIGDSLKAVENTDLVIPSDLCIMRERFVTTTAKWNLTNSLPGDEPIRDYSGHRDGRVDIVYKLRELPLVSGVSDLLHFGFMTKKQAATLLALLASLRR